jgi:transposase-like protein
VKDAMAENDDKFRPANDEKPAGQDPPCEICGAPSTHISFKRAPPGRRPRGYRSEQQFLCANCVSARTIYDRTELATELLAIMEKFVERCADGDEVLDVARTLAIAAGTVIYRHMPNTPWKRVRSRIAREFAIALDGLNSVREEVLKKRQIAQVGVASTEAVAAAFDGKTKGRAT